MAPTIRPSRHRNTRPSPRLRLAVYRKSGFRCVHCGWEPRVPPDYDGRLALGDAYHCPRTRRLKLRFLEIDHIHPHVLGGRLREDNCQALCSPCNARKGAKV